MSTSRANRRTKLLRAAEAFGARVAAAAVCEGHSAPLDFLESWAFDRPALSLVHGPRGGGKSFLAGLATHLDSLRHDDHGTRILGGSLAQSRQIHEALRTFDRARPGLVRLTRTKARYVTGSEVQVLAASPHSVRGPHVPTLRLDEVDEIDPDIREAALGMCLGRAGVSGSVSLTSTWHRVGGPMEELLARGRAGAWPTWSFCTFEVLERCPPERSGPHLENCPACPLVKWCHDGHPGGPKAKRASGHYPIGDLIQKAGVLSARVFESDFLCLGPRADGLWFPGFEPARAVTAAAEFDPALPVRLALDSGVFSGAVFWQLRFPGTPRESVTVFGDYLVEGATAETVARALREQARQLCLGRIDVIATDPAGGQRNPVGPSVLAEYERAGLRPLATWPPRPVADGLALVDSFLAPADGSLKLLIHPRCAALISALRHYRRAKRGGQWQDYPEDPQHPHEDLVDALRGGLTHAFPSGRRPPLGGPQVHVSRIRF